MAEVCHSSSSCKRLTEDSYDDLFDYLQQFDKLVNAYRVKKLEKSHDPLALVAHTGTAANVQCYNCSEKGHYARNCPKPRVRYLKYFMEQMLITKHDEPGVILTDEQNDFLFADASWMEEIKELNANLCLIARIQLANFDSDAGPSYNSTFLSEFFDMSSYNHFGCSCCGGSFNGRNCLACSSVGSGNEFVHDPNQNSFDNPPDFSYQSPHPTYETYSCELCGNDFHFSNDCPPRFLVNHEPEPGYIQNYNSYPHDSPSFLQQYPCCEGCEGPHESFQCQPMNQNFYEPNLCYNSISFDFDPFQPPQFPAIHQPPQETGIEILHDQENVLLLAWDRVSKIKNAFGNNQYKPEDIQELFRKLSIDVQNWYSGIVSNYIREKPTRVVPPIEAAL
nr:hypothetical protein [Tanacetum cinerariifolium]